MQKPPADTGAEAPVAQAAAVGEAARSPMRSADTSATSSSPDITARLDLRTIKACHDALLNKKSLEYQQNCDDLPVEQTANLMFCRSQQARAAKEVNDALAAAGPCPEDLLNASAYYEAIKELALRGDIPAQRCFITGYFASAAQEGEESRMRKHQVAEYRGLARRFIDEAFERGDWSVVRWLAARRTGLQDGMLISAYPFGSEHPETLYRMNYLLMLGNHHDFEKNVEVRQLVELMKNNKALAPKQFQDAEDWAHRMFDQHFNGSREGASLTQMCES
jgi:hypothetical protein